MNIYIDFDDCLCESGRAFGRLAADLFGKNVPYDEIRYFNLQQAFDLTDEDMDISSLRAYVITNVASKWTPQKTWLPTLSENRNMFRIENGTGS